MAKDPGVRIMAEGAEIQEQVDFLMEVGCLAIQGYCFCKPIPVDKLETIVFSGA